MPFAATNEITLFIWVCPLTIYSFGCDCRVVLIGCTVTNKNIGHWLKSRTNKTNSYQRINSTGAVNLRLCCSNLIGCKKGAVMNGAVNLSRIMLCRVNGTYRHNHANPFCIYVDKFIIIQQWKFIVLYKKYLKKSRAPKEYADNAPADL